MAYMESLDIYNPLAVKGCPLTTFWGPGRWLRTLDLDTLYCHCLDHDSGPPSLQSE